MRYALSQAGIWLTVFILFSIIDINYNGVSWEYSLAYGALLPLAFWRFRDDRHTLYCLAAAALYWIVGRSVELSPTPRSMSESIEVAGLLCLVSLMCERYRMLVVSVALLIYSVRLSFIEASYLQQGFLNLIFASLVFVQPRMKPDVPSAGHQRQEFKEAA